MKQPKYLAWTTATVVATTLALASVASAQTLTPLEAKCSSVLGKSMVKTGLTYLKSIAKCRNADISGKAVGSCPDDKADKKITKALAKISARAAKTCGSVCSISTDVPCVSDATCPPLGKNPGLTAEKCTAGPALKVFDFNDLNFPGPFCEAILGGPISNGADFGDCVGSKTIEVGAKMISLIYGSVDNTAGLVKTEAKCLDTIAKAAAKFSSRITKGVIKCRSAIEKGKVLGNPATCTTDDDKLVANIIKAETKLRADIAKKCIDDDIAKLDLCGAGLGATTTVVAAQDCVSAATKEISDDDAIEAFRTYANTTFIEAAYPLRPLCGDGTVNQTPHPFLLLGEECDGSDDDACPGLCFPPGDIWECTCGGTYRSRLIHNGFTAALDSGWTGTSHNGGTADGAGYILERSNCDCTDMTDCDCTGTSTDPVCDMAGKQLPVCIWDSSLSSTTRCDAHGNGNAADEDSDCWRCNQFSANAGAFCASEDDCTAQCFDAAGAVTGSCLDQSDCATGEACRGQCDRTPTCIVTPNGAPLPISSGGSPVCVLSLFRENVFGTQDMVSGDADNFVQLFSVTHLGVSPSRPCPICGGFCNGGDKDGEICQGTCSGGGDPCRTETDCPGGETCTSAAYLDGCAGQTCNISEVCFGGPNNGSPCRIEAGTRDFGTTSNDCPPDTEGKNISGQGLEIFFWPATTGSVSLSSALPCTAPGFELFDCPCPADGGTATRPNFCAGACSAGVKQGQGCVTGIDGAQGGSFGEYTACAGGVNDGISCDEDGDCPGGACSSNPLQCEGTGDPDVELRHCASDADCNDVPGACVDACPGGKCLPLCAPSPADAEEGLCVAGPSRFHCDGEGHSFRGCTKAEVGTQVLCELGVNGIPDEDDNPGAGFCAEFDRSCYLNPLTASGIPGPTNFSAGSVYCIGRTTSPTINAIAGLGGPGRLRQEGVNNCNHSSIP